MFNEEQNKNRAIVADAIEKLKNIRMNTSELRDDCIIVMGLTSDHNDKQAELNCLTTGTNISVQKSLFKAGEQEPMFKEALYMAAAELMKNEKEVPLLFAALEIVKSVAAKKQKTACKAITNKHMKKVQLKIGTIRLLTTALTISPSDKTLEKDKEISGLINKLKEASAKDVEDGSILELELDDIEIKMLSYTMQKTGQILISFSLLITRQ